MTQRAYKSIDLFAGIGGIRLGFEQAFGLDSIETTFVSEIDSAARKTYRANFDTPSEIHGDITLVPETDINPFDICLAGFPCQAFSMAGKRMGFDDLYKGTARGNLFFELARICKFHQPKVIFCENVKGLPIHKKGDTFKTIIDTLDEIGYKVFWAILNSKHFGVPQSRERVYIVAFRKDIAPDTFSFPQGMNTPAVTINDILDPSPIPSKYYLSERYLDTLRKHRERQRASGNGFGYEIRKLDGIAGTISCGGMGRERNLIVDSRDHSMVPTTNIKGPINNEDVRKMTPREWARLQGFPETFDMPVSDASAYKQLGNSVTVPVIREIALSIKETLLRTQ